MSGGASPSRRTMEEVWRDISLSSLNQDMPSTRPLSLHYHHAANPTTTATYFNSVTLQDFLSGDPANPIPPSTCTSERSSSSCHVGLAMIQNEACGGNGAVDRRKTRMIKNRESAARSRARKQAYTNELEKEVAHLLKENGTLKLKYEELLKQTMAAPLTVAKKRKIQRTSSSPF